MTTESKPASEPGKVETIDQVVIRFAGDSGDGMQVTGDRFTDESALFGNDLSTFPNYPAEIRAPAGTLAGVSAFQIHISDHEILTPGDAPNVLVTMNPAALKANVNDLPTGGTLVINVDSFDERDLAKAGYETNPLEDGSLSAFRIYEIPMTSLTVEACKPTGAKPHAMRSAQVFSRSGCCLGSTTGRSATPSTGSSGATADRRSWPRPTRSPSGPGTTLARPRRYSSPHMR